MIQFQDIRSQGGANVMRRGRVLTEGYDAMNPRRKYAGADRKVMINRDKPPRPWAAAHGTKEGDPNASTSTTP